jgi:hypothetical protein
MLGITTLRKAVTALADNLFALANTAAEVNDRLRERLALDAPEAEPLPAPADNGKARGRAGRAS